MSKTKVPPTEKKSNDVDDYTAKMDHMVEKLKRKSELEREKRKKIMLMWLGIGSLIIVLSIFLMMNFSSNGLEGAFNLLMKQ